MKRFPYALSSFILLAIAWHMAAQAGFWSPVLLPAPESVANYLGHRFHERYETRVGRLPSAASWLPRECEISFIGQLLAQLVGRKRQPTSD